LTFEGLKSSTRPTVWRILFKLCPLKEKSKIILESKRSNYEGFAQSYKQTVQELEND